MAHPHRRDDTTGRGTPRHDPHEARVSRIFIPEPPPIGLGRERRIVHTTATPEPLNEPIEAPPAPAPTSLPPMAVHRLGWDAREYTPPQIAALVNTSGVLSLEPGGKHHAPRLRLRVHDLTEADARPLAQWLHAKTYETGDVWTVQLRSIPLHALLDLIVDDLDDAHRDLLSRLLDELGSIRGARARAHTREQTRAQARAEHRAASSSI